MPPVPFRAQPFRREPLGVPDLTDVFVNLNIEDFDRGAAFIEPNRWFDFSYLRSTGEAEARVRHTARCIGQIAFIAGEPLATLRDPRLICIAHAGYQDEAQHHSDAVHAFRLLTLRERRAGKRGA